jgi:anti-anti-sigma regulatory factor
MTPTEFAVLLTTFVAIHLTNVQVGMGLGVISAACIFALNYAMLPALVLPRHPHSSVMRNFEERRILAVHLDEVAVLSLRGYIFFGSAIKLVQEVEKHIFWEGGNCEEHGGEIETEEQHLLDRRLSASPTKSPGGLRARLSNTQMNFTPIFNRGGSLSFVGEEDAAGGGASPSFLSGASRGAHRNVVYDGEMGAEVKEKMNVYMEIWADSPMDRARQPSQTGSCFGTQAKQTKYIALDFEHVVGVDCTAARVSFLMLRTLCRQAGVQLVFAGVRHKGILQILEANGVLTSTDRAFDDVDAALEWCEEEILSTVALAPVKSPSPRSLQSILGDYLELREYNFDNSMRSTLDAAVHFFELERHSAEGTVIFSEEEAATKLYFISHGEVELERPGRKRLAKLRAGATFGELGFFLKSSQSFRAVTTSKECILYTLSRRAMASMQRENPVLLTVLQKAILKSMCLADSTAISHAI